MISRRSSVTIGAFCRGATPTAFRIPLSTICTRVPFVGLGMSARRCACAMAESATFTVPGFRPVLAISAM